MKMNILRMTTAGVLVVALGATLFPYATSYVSSSAVVNAPIINVTSPINGIVSVPSKGAAVAVLDGETLLVIENSQTGRGAAEGLQTALLTLSGEIAGIRKQSEDLRELRKSLLKRKDDHVLARMTWFVPRIAQAEANIQKAKAQLVRAQDNFDRYNQLAGNGSVTQTSVVEATADLAGAKADLAEAEALRVRLEVERDTIEAKNGVDLTSNAFEQIEYRLDEVTVRLADLDARLLEQQARKSGLSNQINAMSIDMIRQDTFEPIVSTNGIIWEASVKAGSSVAEGEKVAAILDCARRFIEVELPERHFESIPVGTTARVRLSGSAEVKVLKVVAAYGSGARPNRDMQAASPRIEASNGLKVILGVGPKDVTDTNVARSFCDVGRTADVRFDLHEDSIISRISTTFQRVTGNYSPDVAVLPDATDTATKQN